MKVRYTAVLLFALVIMAFMLVGCSESNNTGTAASAPSTSLAATPAPTKASAPQHFKVGQAVNVGDPAVWQVTVNSVKTSTGSQYEKPEKGQFILIDVSLKNVSAKEQDVSSLLNFKFTDDTGVSYTEGYFSGAANSPNGKVEAGMPARGTLVYDVPTSVHKLTLAFAPDMLSSGQVIWDITV